MENALEDDVYYVLKVTENGAVAWKCQTERKGGELWLRFDPSLGAHEKPWTFLHIADPNMWYGVQTVAEPPSYLQSKVGHGMETPSIGVRLLDMEIHSLLELNAQSAFIGWNVTMMSKLFDWLQLPLPKPRLEMELARALVLGALGDIGEDELKRILSQRNAEKASALFANITEEDQSLVEEAVAESDRSALTDAVAKAARTHKPRNSARIPASSASVADAAASSSSAPPAPPVAAPPLPPPPGPPPALPAPSSSSTSKPRPVFHAIGAEEGRRYLPRSKGCTMSKHKMSVGW